MTAGNASGEDASRLYRWIARASFPEERLRCKAFTVAERQDEVVLESRRKSWNALFDSDVDSESAKEEVLRRRGLSRAQWEACLRDVEVTAPEHLPDWAATFIDLYRRRQRHGVAEAKRPADNPYLRLPAAWAESCRPWVGAQQDKLRAAGIELAEQGVDDLLEHLLYRLTTPLFAVLRSYPGALPADGGGTGSLDFWQQAFDRQPILVKIIGDLVRHWQIATEEMLDRFAADLPQLRARFLRGKEAQPGGGIVILRLPCGLGDPHRGGRSVAIFETDCGEVVYKPKDLLGTRATGELLRELHREHGEFVPLAPEFLYCRGYGWEQRIARRDCGTLPEVETFYRRLGGWLFLVQLLNGNDFWYDNLIACADMPYFIDYETVVGNSLFAPKAARGQSEHLEQFRQMGVIGILPMLMPGSMDDSPEDGIDISVMTPPGKQRVPFRKGERAGAADADEWFGSFEAGDYAPFYRGEFQDINAFFDVFIDGYKRMGALLDAQEGAASAALQKFYRRIKQARFRHIIVDTWQCYALLDEFFYNCRTDGVRATIALDSFFARFKWYPTPIVEGIRHDIWRNDVPLFEMQTDSLRVFNTSGAATETDFFQKTAWDRITRNHAYLPAELERQVVHIKALFSTRPDNPRRAWRLDGATATGAPKPKPQPKPVAREALLVLARETGAQLASRINRRGALRDWLAIGRAQLNNVRVPQPLPRDFNGCSGVVVFLALLRQYDTERKENSAALRKCHPYLMDDINGIYPLRDVLPHCGVISRFGSRLVALCRLARVEAELRGDGNPPAADIEKLMDDLLNDMRGADSLCADYRHGIGGLLYRFGELEPFFSGEKLTEWMEQILALAGAKPLRVSPAQTAAYRRYADALLPDAAHGMVWVDGYMQARWSPLAAHPGYLKLQRLVASGDDADARTATQPAPPAEDYTDEALSALRGETAMDCAYHLLAGAGDDASRATLDRLIAELVARRHISRRWFPDRWADDGFCPGAIHGQADMGLLLLSVYERKNLNPFRAPAGASPALGAAAV